MTTYDWTSTPGIENVAEYKQIDKIAERGLEIKIFDESI